MRLLLLFWTTVLGANAQISYTSGDCVCEDRCRFLSVGCCPPQDCTDSGQGYFPNQPDTPSYYTTNEPEDPTYYPPFPSDEPIYYPPVTEECQNPGPISNGYISSGQANFNVGDKVTYSCRKGYKLEGNSEQVCTSSLVYFLPFSAAPSWVPENKPECKATNPCHLHSCDSHADCVPDHDRVGYTCRCRHGYTGNGYSCKRITCPAPPFPVNGTYRPVRKIYRVGSTITYACDGWYTLIGSSKRNCTASGTFSGLAPICVDPCNILNCPPHSMCSAKNGEAVCDCVTGYSLAPGGQCNKIDPCENQFCHKFATCFPDHTGFGFECRCNDGYFGNGFQCKKITCPASPFPANGWYSPVQMNYPIGSTITYGCDKGYELEGDRLRNCSANGTFSGFTKCVVITCPAPPFPANGNYRPAQKTYPMGSTIIYECDYGYILVGRNSERKCTANGKFSGFAPKCVDPCQMMDCIPHSVCSVKNGEARCDCVTGYSLGPGGQCNQIFPCTRNPCDANAKCTDIDVKRYKCDCNYRYTGNGKVCRKLKPCELEPCDANAKCTDIDDRRYTCDCLPGYKGDGKKCIRMYPCELNPCHEMADCVNINYTHYRCDCKTGYQGSGKYCERITCPVPPFPANGKYRPVQKTYPMGSTITYECDYGYMLLGDSERNCTANGTFNGFIICLDLCQMVECIPHSVCSVKNGEAVCDCVTGYSLGPGGQCNEIFPCERNPCDANAKCTDIDVKRYKCDCNYGYTGNGKVCRRITCPAPTFPSNGKYRPVQKTYPMGSTITYECDYGYMLVGFNERNCTAKGTFNGFVLCDKIDPCELVNCPSHSTCSVKNGEAVCDCVTGYSLASGGQCNRITCPVPPFPTNGKYRPVQKTFPMGSTITYECDEGYKLAGFGERKCSANGRFSGFTKCVDLCQMVECIPHSMCSVKNGEAVCDCVTGYSLGPGGQCKEIFPCKRNPCDANAKCTDIDARRYRCDCNYGYAGNGKVCRRVTCPAPPLPTNGKYRPIQKTYSMGSMITYECDFGYMLLGDSERNCIAKGSFSGFAICAEIPTTAPPTTTTALPTTPPLSCKDACGAYGFGSVCACDAGCMRAGNCCYDYTLHCGSGYSWK